MNDVLLSIEDLHVQFVTYAGVIRAVNGMSFEVREGEVFGLVGESGCGKSVTGFSVLPSARTPVIAKPKHTADNNATATPKGTRLCAAG